jgi:hypothetical protein
MEDDPFVGDFDCHISRFFVRQVADGESAKQYEYGEKKITEVEGEYRATQSYNAEYPIPVCRSAVEVVLGSLPFDYAL